MSRTKKPRKPPVRKMKMMAIYLPEETIERVKRRAERDRRTVASLGRVLIEEGLGRGELATA